MDYRKYQLKKKEVLLYGAEAAFLTGITAFCFYDSLWMCAVFPLVLYLFLKEKRRELLEKRKKELKLQFKAAVQALASALAAGYSAENALREAGKDMRLLYDQNAAMVQELAGMQRKLDANQTLEEAIRDFAGRSAIEEAETFAEIFGVAKRSGGDLIEIMKDTSRTISQTIETERQVAGILASRRYEQKIMNRVPFALILYLRIGCPGFLDPLYGNVPGACLSTLCLGLYVGAWYLGRKLLEIEV